jgi:hypothetical protein
MTQSDPIRKNLYDIPVKPTLMLAARSAAIAEIVGTHHNHANFLEFCSIPRDLFRDE